MTIRGEVKDGVVIPDAGTSLPEGARVVIQILSADAAGAAEEDAKAGSGRRAYSRFAGIIDDLPSDASENVDHYLYGHPKQ